MSAEKVRPLFTMTAELSQSLPVATQPAPTAREKVERLQAIISTMPQADSMVTDHYFVPGMYCRKLARKAGTLIVGKVHKAPHFFMCAAGEILVLDGERVRRMQAGDIIECKPGTKRATFAVTDAVGVTIHKTDSTDLAQIEVELIETDDKALFDATNNVIHALLQGEGL
jgi:quercetin dioxygenase-like cupin family protein